MKLRFGHFFFGFPRRAVRPGITPVVACGLLGALACATLWMIGCQGSAPASPLNAPSTPSGQSVPLASARSIRAEPMIRVRIAADTAATTVSGAAVLRIGSLQGDGVGASARRFRAPVQISHEDDAFVLRTAAGDFRWAASRLAIVTPNDEPIAVGETRYPGSLVLVPLQYRGRATGRFDVVNHVGLEAYLPGVVEHELWPRWHARAFEAQAVAARSYALFERRMNADRHYDLTSTTASQVYGGQGANPTALAAVRRTRGQVMVYNGRVLPTFYSSCCGGTSQSAAVAFARLGRGVDLPPLRSRQRTAWCRPSTHFRWGPIQRHATELAQRLAAWGQANEHAIGALRDLRRIDITAHSDAGRPEQFIVTDAAGQRYTLWAEQFRFACNHAASGLAELSFDEQIRSSHVQPRVHGRIVRFTNGRGWGHGVGMCQWGAQGMAERGYDTDAILRNFYPGARVQRLY